MHPSADYSNMREQFKWFSQIDAIRLKSGLRDESDLQNNEVTVYLTNLIEWTFMP